MNKTKDQQAQEYVEKKIESEYGISRDDFIAAGCRFGYNDVVQTYSDGYTAAEQSMWRSVEDELPKDDETVLTYSSFGHVLAYYSEQDKMWFAYGNYGDINPTHWMPIPELSGTNTEKK